MTCARLRRVGASCGALLVLGSLLVPAAAAVAAPVAPRVDRILVVSVPGLGWDDVRPEAMPAFSRLADRGATAALSVKTIGRRTDPPAAYATIGAGTRATAPHGAGSSAFAVDERTPSGRLAGEQVRADGVDPGGAALVVLDPDAVAAANRGLHQGARTGSLGRALQEHGWTTAVVANHDGPGGAVDRVAGLALATRRGRIDAGATGADLVQVGPDGLRRTRTSAVTAAVAALPGRQVVALVEVGDVDWADAAHAPPAVRARAVAHADATLAAVTAEAGPHDLVVVLAPAAPRGRDQPTPFVLAGPGVEAGQAESATTRVAGHVTLPDLSATILDRIGVTVPAAMDGAPITVDPSAGSGAARIALTREAVAETRFVDRATGILLTTLPIVFASWSLLALLASVVPLGPAAPAARLFVRWIGLGLLAVPTLTYLLGAVSVRTWGQPAWALAAWGGGGLVAAALVGIRRRAVAPLLLIGAAWLVQVADLLTGGRLQFGTVLGNSPTVAGRFAGMGNNAFALLAASSLVLAVVLWRAVEDRRPGWPALAAASAVFAVAIVVDGAPSMGSDVGGVLALGPVAALTVWTLAGRRTSLLRVAVAGGATVAVLAALAAADLSRPDDRQTHLGRLVRRVSDGGSLEVFVRKALAALTSFTSSSLVWIVICVALLAGLLRLLAGPASARLRAHPQARVLVPAALVLAVLGAGLNDSGVMVPAMMATVLVPAAVQLFLGPGGPGADPGPRAWPWADRRPPEPEPAPVAATAQAGDPR